MACSYLSCKNGINQNTGEQVNMTQTTVINQNIEMRLNSGPLAVAYGSFNDENWAVIMHNAKNLVKFKGKGSTEEANQMKINYDNIRWRTEK